MQCWPGETDDEWEEDLPDNIRLFDGVGFYIRSIVYYIVDCVYTEIDAKKTCAHRLNETPEQWLDRVDQNLNYQGKLWTVQKGDLCAVAKKFMVDNVWEKKNAKRFGTMLKQMAALKKFVPKEFNKYDSTLSTKHLMKKTFLKTYYQVVKFSTGGDHYLILTRSGKVFSGGRNNFGQLGLPKIHQHFSGEIWDERNAIDIACGYATSFIVAQDGRAYGTGCNLNGRLGIGDLAPQTNGWTRLLAPPMKRVEAGSVYAMGLGMDDYVYTWGAYLFAGHANVSRATHKQGMQPSLSDLHSPKRLRCVGKALTISIGSGGYHSVVLAANGSVFLWGHNRVGQLSTPNDSVAHVISPIPHVLLFPRFSIVYAAATWGNTVCINQGGECWISGRNCCGQLGMDNTTSPKTENGTPFSHNFKLLLPDTANVQNLFVTEQSVFVVYPDYVRVAGRAKRVLLNDMGAMHVFQNSSKRFIWEMNGNSGNSYYFYLH